MRRSIRLDEQDSTRLVGVHSISKVGMKPGSLYLRYTQSEPIKYCQLTRGTDIAYIFLTFDVLEKRSVHTGDQLHKYGTHHGIAALLDDSSSLRTRSCHTTRRMNTRCGRQARGTHSTQHRTRDSVCQAHKQLRPTPIMSLKSRQPPHDQRAHHPSYECPVA